MIINLPQSVYKSLLQDLDRLFDDLLLALQREVEFLLFHDLLVALENEQCLQGPHLCDIVADNF